MKKIIAAVIAVSILCTGLLISCTGSGDGGDSSEVSKKTSDTADGATDELPEKNYDGAKFIIYDYIGTGGMLYPTLGDEDADEAISASEFIASTSVEDRFGIVFDEITVPDLTLDSYADAPRAGSYEYDFANARCIYAVPMYTEELMFTFDDPEMKYCDLSKDYWNQIANESLTIQGNHYAVIGGYSVATYSLVHALVFNKKLVEDLKLSNPYELVNNKEWTLDEFNKMVSKDGVVFDLNGDSVMDGEDRYGYLAHFKEVLPSFWVAAGTFSIIKDDEDIPVINMGSTKFLDVYGKILEYTRDNNAWYNGTNWDGNLPTFCVQMFTNGQSLFIDTSLYTLEFFRSAADIEFGIIPYPMYDENQESYYSRLEYYNTFVVPISVEDPERASIILEALNCAYYKTFLPAYHETALQRKYTRDIESSDMLDIIFKTMVVDLGDTTWCGYVRDGFLKDMYHKNNKNLSSKLASYTKYIQAEIDKAIK